MTDQTRELLSAVLADLAEVVGGISPAQLHHPTPCTDYDVAQLRDHVLHWLTTFADAFADQPGSGQLETITAAADRMDQALRAGAASRPLRLGDSAMPGDMALSMILWEYQMHGWDLARATSQAWSPPAAAAEESLEFAPGMLTADYQGEGKAFAPRVPVPESAPAFDRLLGLSGRDPAWAGA
jgi:uncharacterized protein (TIGR03086 family)